MHWHFKYDAIMNFFDPLAFKFDPHNKALTSRPSHASQSTVWKERCQLKSRGSEAKDLAILAILHEYEHQKMLC